MMVSTKGRYALMVLIDIAQNVQDEYIPLVDIAERQGLSMKYLEIVVAMLNKGKLITSRRGKNGGYKLVKNLEEYNINEILEITEGSLSPVTCIGSKGVKCDKATSCVTLPLWIGLDRTISDYLSKISLKDIIDENIENIDNDIE